MSGVITGTAPLSVVEAGRLRECETAVDRGLKTFVEVGRALTEIRVSRLYRCTHNTFEAYCQKRFGFTRARAFQLSAASVVVENIDDRQQLLTHESLARPLVNLPPGKQREAWGLALERAQNRKVTARHVREAAVAVNGGTGNNQWFTPSEYIERARRVLGAVDLDPASCTEAQTTVGAARYFTIEDDGLAQEWSGRVWLNPPYSGLLGKFIYKLLDEYESGNVPAAVLLTHSATDEAWFHRAVKAATAVCFTEGRIRFVAPGGERPGQGQRGHVFYYFGPDLDVFAAEFCTVGSIVTPLLK